MERRKRLNRTNDIQRVRQKGRSFPNPLLVLIVMPEMDLPEAKVGVIATRSVGGAVERNRAKRLIRAAVDEVYDFIQPDCKIILLARKPILEAESAEIVSVLLRLLQKAGIYNASCPSV